MFIVIAMIFAYVIFFGISYQVIWGIKSITHLDQYKVASTFIENKKVSIIVPIHNEEKKLEKALVSLCQLDYENYEIIAVNDRSSDGSQKVLEKIQERFGKIKIVKVSDCPNDWLGKVNALSKGIEKATGDYFLFTDADVIMDKGLLTRSIIYSSDLKLDHLTIIPKLILKSFSMKMYMLFQTFIMYVFLQPHKAKNSKHKQAIGCGAFNLISKNMYENIGGLESIRLSPDDDMALARQVKKHAGKSDFVYANNDLKVEWYGSISEVVTGLQKNTYAVNDFSLIKSMISIVGLIYLFFSCSDDIFFCTNRIYFRANIIFINGFKYWL